MSKNSSFSISNPDKLKLDAVQKIGLIVALLGVSILFVAWFGITFPYPAVFLSISALFIFIGTVVYAKQTYLKQPAGIKNNNVWFNSLSNRGVLGWFLGIVLTLFYVLLYWFPSYLGYDPSGAQNRGLVALFDPLSLFFNGKIASQWFVYGTLYTLLIASLGIKFMYKYRHNRYQLIRTVVVIVSQLFLAYLIPEILEGLNSDTPYFAKDIKNMWPLNYYFFEPWHLDNMINGGTLGMLYLVIGIFMFLVFTPIITYYVGKRWYCSWVCGCGGLAETAGDSFRQLSSKTVSSWKIERWMIHTVMVLIFIVTAVVLYGYFANSGEFLGISIYNYFSKPYGFLIGAMFSGVVGVGFYPVLGSRVWCRFGCPLAGYMGLFQRFKSRFRITTNGGQCISCGNCSTYCEQGIDVRAYAQKGENIVRASCVGCGICSAVCPRGVLKLENGPEEGRINPTDVLLGNDIDLMNYVNKKQ
ncbi:4Fe-4S binding domain-containing protein [Lutibacter oricola]|uniref:4Fe-4S binding domain-containing protein n=1 Tax=Lutibacter oricola TaxID=762486 RepID=A0A1H2ZGQ4_9FLAO|nr:4Fe-4S dicluster domain-containing protein [Lutibacter oricola]SDX15909.1 4Fe-4S binding domain-containing protein [Lutibacter oricola]